MADPAGSQLATQAGNAGMGGESRRLVNHHKPKGAFHANLLDGTSMNVASRPGV